MNFHRKNIVVTGGLGFIGSNLAIRLVELGARVTIIDPVIEGCGGNPYNIAPVASQVEVVPHSIGETAKLLTVLRCCDLIFNLAGEISHIHSMVLPERDLQLNTLDHLRFLQACVDCAPGIRILYAGTRQVYGVPEYLPVDEKHAVNPVDFNGVHKYAATQYHLMLSRTGELDAAVVRLTNVYGPRIALDTPCQGFLSTYLRKALTGQTLEIFGDGRQLRDPVYVDDAVEAMLRVAAADCLPSRSYNVGGPEALSMAEIALAVSRAATAPEPVFREFPEERKGIDIGSYYTDSNLLRQHFGWRPATRFEDGVDRTLAYCREHLTHYLDPANPNPTCKLAHKSARERAGAPAAV